MESVSTLNRECVYTSSRAMYLGSSGVYLGNYRPTQTRGSFDVLRLAAVRPFRRVAGAAAWVLLLFPDTCHV